MQEWPEEKRLIRFSCAANGEIGVESTEKEKQEKCLGGVSRCIGGCVAFENGDSCVMLFLKGKSRRKRRGVFGLGKRVGKNHLVVDFRFFIQKAHLGLCKISLTFAEDKAQRLTCKLQNHSSLFLPTKLRTNRNFFQLVILGIVKPM